MANNNKKVELAEDDYVYYTHPSGKVEEMTRADAAKLEKENGNKGVSVSDPADLSGAAGHVTK